jgi:hypothetical protein
MQSGVLIKMSVIKRRIHTVAPDLSSIVIVVFAFVLLTAVGMVLANTFSRHQIAPIALNGEMNSWQNRAAVPNNSRLFALVTGPSIPILDSEHVFGDDRVFLPIPGAAAALSALYYSDGNLVVYDIDPNTGEGILAINVSPAVIAAALANAAQSGEPVLIAKGISSELYALPNGQCQLNGLYPDGKSFGFVFDCP